MGDPCRARDGTEDPAESPGAEQHAELGGAHAQRTQDEDRQEHLDARAREGGGRDAGEEREEQALASYEGQTLMDLCEERGSGARGRGLGGADAPDGPGGQRVGQGGEQVDQGRGDESEEPSAQARSARVLKVHHLRPAPGAKTAKTRVGRGEGSKGKTAGRGTKGTKARYQVPARFEGGQMPIHMRLPKLRGFKNPFRVEYQVVNVSALGELFPQGGEVTVEDLVAKGAVRDGHPVKILGQGDLAVKLDVTADAWSASAKEKIEAAGGSVAGR